MSTNIKIFLETVQKVSKIVEIHYFENVVFWEYLPLQTPKQGQNWGMKSKVFGFSCKFLRITEILKDIVTLFVYVLNLQ